MYLYLSKQWIILFHQNLHSPFLFARSRFVVSMWLINTKISTRKLVPILFSKDIQGYNSMSQTVASFLVYFAGPSFTSSCQVGMSFFFGFVVFIHLLRYLQFLSILFLPPVLQAPQHSIVMLYVACGDCRVGYFILNLYSS